LVVLLINLSRESAVYPPQQKLLPAEISQAAVEESQQTAAMIHRGCSIKKSLHYDRDFQKSSCDYLESF
jgi:hypothetical protein